MRTTKTRGKALATRVDSVFAAFARVGPSEFMVLKPVLKSHFPDMSQLKIIADAIMSKFQQTSNQVSNSLPSQL